MGVRGLRCRRHFFMHSLTQKKCDAKAAHGARGVGKMSFLPNCVCASKGRMQRKNISANYQKVFLAGIPTRYLTACTKSTKNVFLNGNKTKKNGKLSTGKMRENTGSFIYTRGYPHYPLYLVGKHMGKERNLRNACFVCFY